MRLKRVHITEYQSVRDSNSFEVGDITCLVGKNEAGKTALLKALYRLSPYVATEGKFDVTDDYPRRDVEDYRHDVEIGGRDPARVVRATFELGDVEVAAIEDEFGINALTSRDLELSKGYDNVLYFAFGTNMEAAIAHVVGEAQLLPEVSEELAKAKTAESAVAALASAEATSEVTRLTELFTELQKSGLTEYLWAKHIKAAVPRFLYFDEYYQMRGAENIEALKQRKANNQLVASDHPMLGLIELARLDLDAVLAPERTQELQNKLEGAGNHLSKQVLKYWSQNRHLGMRFDVRPARPGDPAGMTSGTNIWAKVHDSRHMVSTDLGTRSKGFVWFFSFLAWYSQIQRRQQPVVLLLDEPGLTLHGKAQGDLLRYFEAELKPNHQVIYTTHSPFMVDPRVFSRVRIVEDRGIDTDEPLPAEKEGTKVLSEALEASGDSLFPLQGALGYEIYQTLFIGPNSLVVEGVSDLLYLQTMSGLLEGKGQAGLDQRWTITPVGGADKIPTFVALIGAQQGLNIATLIDYHMKDQQTIENLFKRKLLKKTHLITFADILSAPEADIEDLFEVGFYLKLVNAEYSTVLAKPVTEAALPKHPRILVRLERYFEKNPMKGAAFNHYRPARYLAENIGTLGSQVGATTLANFGEAFSRVNALLVGGTPAPADRILIGT